MRIELIKIILFFVLCSMAVRSYSGTSKQATADLKSGAQAKVQ